MAETVRMPKLGFDMAEGTLVRWVKKEGETVNKGEVLAEIETDKATVEVESSASGLVRKLLVDEGSVVPVNTPIAIVGSAEEKLDLTASQAASRPEPESPAATAKPDQPTRAGSAVPVPASGPLRASPLAKKVARESQVDLSKINGSGPGGRIVRRDIEAALSGAGSLLAAVGPAFTPQIPVSHSDELVPLTKLRQAIARRMVESKTALPHFYLTREFRMEALLELRRQLNAMLAEQEKVSVNDFIVKGVALALRQFPNLNAAFQGDKLLRRGRVNVGVAVAVEGGLLTVVCRDADQKGLRQIASEIKALATKARDGKVRPDDIEGSSFSISNLGMYEVENFIAIINPPEAAILAVGSAREVPVVENGLVKTGWRMKASLSVDHRVSDGAEAARFMQTLAVFLEEPLRLVL